MLWWRRHSRAALSRSVVPPSLQWIRWCASLQSAGRVHLAIVNAGSAVGEGGFFSQMPRNATVQAVGDCRLWNLTHIRFTELSQKLPRVALALAMGLGAVLTRRMTDRRKRISVT